MQYLFKTTTDHYFRLLIIIFCPFKEFWIHLNRLNLILLAIHFRLKNIPQKILDQFTDYLVTDNGCDQVFDKKWNNYWKFHGIHVVDTNLGAPDVVEIDELPGETTNDTITLKWKEPESNGKVITMYTVYQRVVTDGKVGQWIEVRRIRDVFVRELKIALERGKVYQFAITATNELGESLKQEKANIQQVKAEGSMFKWILFSPFNGLSFSLLGFQALSVSSTSRFLRVNSSLVKTLINEKISVDIVCQLQGYSISINWDLSHRLARTGSFK